MTERCRFEKVGLTSRLEQTQRSRSIVEIRESGTARYEGATFVATAAKGEGVGGDPVPAERLAALASRVDAAVARPLRLDRLVVAAGSATHRFVDADGERVWKEPNARCFASISRPDTSLQIEIDLGAPALEEIDLSPLLRAAEALLLFRGEMPAPPVLRLAPAVSAALWRALLGAEAADASARIFQSTHPSFRLDGNGMPIETHFGPPWPNMFRPSYRGAPVAMPFHLDVETDAIDVEADVSAVALLEPIRLVNDRLVLVTLSVAGGAAHRVVVAQTPAAWLRSIEGAGAQAEWFPLGAGSWGRDVRVVR